MRVCTTSLLLLLPVYEQVVYSIFMSEENTPFSAQVAHKHIDKYSNFFPHHQCIGSVIKKVRSHDFCQQKKGFSYGSVQKDTRLHMTGCKLGAAWENKPC